MNIVTRAEWGAQRPKRTRAIDTPTSELWLHHTAGNERGPAGMRSIQAFHMAPKPAGRGWSDIAYSFLVDPGDLTIYEGRGAGVAGGHTAGRNTVSHAICVLGNFDSEVPSDALLGTIAELVAHGHHAGWWPAQITGGHRHAPGASTACPGGHLQAVITTINAQAITPTEEDDMRGMLQLDQALSSLQRIYHSYGRGGDEYLLWYDDFRKKLRRGEDLNPTLEFVDDELARQKAPS